jgi:hypothetical protein
MRQYLRGVNSQAKGQYGGGNKEMFHYSSPPLNVSGE